MRLLTPLRGAAVLGSVVIVAGLLAGCAPGDSSGSVDEISQADIDAAMQEPTTLTYWSWLDSEKLGEIVDAFTEKYPAVTIEIENSGQAQQSQLLRTAIEAGSGVPDVVQFAGDFSSFVLTGDLLDLSPYGASELENEFLPSAWGNVAFGDAIYGIPQDTGPSGVLYRTDLLEAAGFTELPTTWEEFAQLAEDYHAATGQYLTNIDLIELNILLAQVGDQQYQWDGGENLTVALDTPERQGVVTYLQDLIDRGVVSVDTEFVDSYYQGLSAGKYASWIVPAWGPTFLQAVAQQTSGGWTAAALPQWDGEEESHPTYGGSKIGVTAASEHPIQAAVFTQFLNSDPAATAILTYDLDLFPATSQQLLDEEWLGYEDPFFGGQQVNTFWAGIADKSTLNRESPVGGFTQQAMRDTLSVALANGDPLADALTALQQKIVEYATSQGFSVTED